MPTCPYFIFCLGGTCLFARIGRSALVGTSLAFSAYLSPHTLAFAVPLFRMTALAAIEQNFEPATLTTKTTKPGRAQYLRIAAAAGVTLLLWSSVLVYASVSLLGNDTWEYVRETYGWTLDLRDLSPNVGIFWYFFTEVFGRFRSYFLFIFHVHPFLYVVPLSLRLWSKPGMLMGICVAIFALYRAYPSLSYISLPVALLTMHPNIIVEMRSLGLHVAGMSLAMTMMPVMWYLWLYPGSGNANYFYNQSLIYNAFASLLLLEFVATVVKVREALRLDYAYDATPHVYPPHFIVTSS